MPAEITEWIARLRNHKGTVIAGTARDQLADLLERLTKPVEEGEVADGLGVLNRAAAFCGWNGSASLEQGVGTVHDLLTRLYRESADLRRERDEARAAAKAHADTVLAEACKPWEHCVGDPPEWESPLQEVWQAAMGYTEGLLASLLGIEQWEGGDGSESLAGDGTSSLRNILANAGLYDKETCTTAADHLVAAEALSATRLDALKKAEAQTQHLLNAVEYAGPPKDYGSPDNPNLCFEARVPVQFVTDARETLAAIAPIMKG